MYRVVDWAFSVDHVDQVTVLVADAPEVASAVCVVYARALAALHEGGVTPRRLVLEGCFNTVEKFRIVHG